jgi:glycosyltransferase involved in cell wall biosynthesis
MLTIITATLNSCEALPRLIKSLQRQTDLNFEWVIADGASTDGTLDLLHQELGAFRVRVDSRPDFGIYDALNRAVKLASGTYYLVVGADDELFPDAVASYKKACFDEDSDFLTARIEVDGCIRGARWPRWIWLNGAFSCISSHAVGVAIKKDLHSRYGFYTKDFPICADQLFILRSIRAGAKIREESFVAGRFNLTGTSGRDVIGSFTESLRVNLAVGLNFWVQFALFVVRVLRYRAFKS